MNEQLDEYREFFADIKMEEYSFPWHTKLALILFFCGIGFAISVLLYILFRVILFHGMSIFLITN